MRIQSLQVDRFGRRTHLSLRGISDGLTVIYGPNGAGKTTCIQFIRWMLYGNCDESCRSYLAESAGPADGSMVITHQARSYTLGRLDDGSRYGSLTVNNGQPQHTNHLVSLLGDMTQSDFDQLYAPSFDREPDLTSLLDVARRRGLALTSRSAPSERAQELRLRIDNYRRDLERLPGRLAELQHLLDRRSALQRKIDALDGEQRRRRSHLDREYEDVNRQIEEVEAKVARLRGEWHAKDTELGARRRELDEAWRAAEEARQAFIRDLRNDLSEADLALDRARGMVADVQRRCEIVDAMLRDQELEAAGRSEPDTVCLVKSIAQQLDDLRQSPHTRPAELSTAFRRADGTTLHPPTHASLDLLRAEVGNLCQLLQDRRSDNRLAAAREETDQLRQCETMLSTWVDTLAKQREQIAQELDEAERMGVSLLVDDDGLVPLDDLGRPLVEPTEIRRVKAVAHTCDGYEPIHPDSDALINQLTHQRQAIQAELDTAERHLRQLFDRRRELEVELQRFADYDIAAARRELVDVEAQIRHAEEADRIRREIDKLEAELGRLRDNVVPSDIMQHAADIVRRLTGGRFASLQTNELDYVSVQEASGPITPYEHLSRGDRDQVFLSLCLAVVDAMRRRGVELPLILNDAFINVDSNRDDAMTAVLTDFVRRGHQILLFTRHRHVAELFDAYEARFLELGIAPVPPVTPIPTPTREVVDQVRFRPYAEAVPPPIERAPLTIPRSRPADVTNVSFGSYQQPGRNVDASEPLLSEDTAIENALVFELETAHSLRELGITTIGQLISATPGYVESQLTYAGFPHRPITHWQRELTLLTSVPGLSIDDARVLVGSGVWTLDAVRSADAESLAVQIKRYLASPRSASHFETAGYRVDPLRVADWIRYARSYGGRSSHGAGDSPDVDGTYARQPRESTGHTRTRSPSSLDSLAASSGLTRASRSRRRSSSRSTHANSRSRATAESGSPDRTRELTFYLNSDAPVVDAPSIGPKTAERLRTAGIVTVGDLLSAEPQLAADQVGYARIKGDTIKEWKSQALLACRIPELRGHDAQVLVACGISSPEELSAMTVDALWSRVRPFIKTTECKRIIRNGKTPNKAEVGDWITWAQSARSWQTA